MGRIYDALNKAKYSHQKPKLALLEAASIDEGATDAFSVEEGGDEPIFDADDFDSASPSAPAFDAAELGDDSIAHFDFLGYSLGRTRALVTEPINAKTQADDWALIQPSATKPRTEISITPTQIDPHLVAFYNGDPKAAAQYNQLALKLISQAATRELRRVLITSAERGDGRTCVTLNLACALTRARQRVLVVDCDLLNPSITRALGIGCEIGLGEVFSGNLRPGDAITRILPYGFDVLPMRERLENPVEMLAAPGFWKLLKLFDADYDFVLFDSSPLFAMGDASLMVRFANTSLLVVRAGALTASQMAKAIAPFTQDDILGVVLNRSGVQ